MLVIRIFCVHGLDSDGHTSVTLSVLVRINKLYFCNHIPIFTCSFDRLTLTRNLFNVCPYWPIMASYGQEVNFSMFPYHNLKPIVSISFVFHFDILLYAGASNSYLLDISRKDFLDFYREIGAFWPYMGYLMFLINCTPRSILVGISHWIDGGILPASK